MVPRQFTGAAYGLLAAGTNMCYVLGPIVVGVILDLGDYGNSVESKLKAYSWVLPESGY